jgi:GAF domain-containing protein
VAADVLADANFPRREAAARAGLRAAFCFPLRSASGVLGVIELYSGDTADPNPDLLATMSALGDQIVQALERRRDVEALWAKEAGTGRCWSRRSTAW